MNEDGGEAQHGQRLWQCYARAVLIPGPSCRIGCEFCDRETGRCRYPRSLGFAKRLRRQTRAAGVKPRPPRTGGSGKGSTSGGRVYRSPDRSIRSDSASSYGPIGDPLQTETPLPEFSETEPADVPPPLGWSWIDTLHRADDEVELEVAEEPTEALEAIDGPSDPAMLTGDAGGAGPLEADVAFELGVGADFGDVGVEYDLAELAPGDAPSVETSHPGWESGEGLFDMSVVEEDRPPDLAGPDVDPRFEIGPEFGCLDLEEPQEEEPQQPFGP